MQYLLLIHGNGGYANAPQSYICTYIARLVKDLSLIRLQKT